MIDDINNINNLLGLNIKKINLCGNPFIKDNKDYKEKLFNIFLSLISIDNTDKEGNDVESTEYENSQNLFEKVEKKFNDEKIDDNENKENNNSEIISYDSNLLDDENIENDLCDEEEEEEEDDEDKESDNKNNDNKEENENDNFDS